MRIQKYLIVFVVILSFVSCKGTDEESCSIIDFDEAQVMTEQELFSKVEIISLQNKDDLTKVSHPLPNRAFADIKLC